MTDPSDGRHPIPRWLSGINPVDLAEALSKLPPNDQYVVAARLAAEVSQGRREEQAAERDASKAVAGDPIWQRYDGGRGYANSWVPRDEIEQRRSSAGPQIPEQRQPAEWAPAPTEDAGAARVRGR
jgi:hypothetical protein